MNVPRVLRTVRHLTPQQLVFWPVRRAQAALPVRPPRHDGRIALVAPPVRAALGTALGAHGPRDADVVARARHVLDGDFVFLNHREHLAPVDWTARHVSHLWSYNLQYFDYALDLAWAARLTNDAAFVDGFARLATDWITACSDGRGDGWEPYALSTRAANWIRALLLLDGRLDHAAERTIVGSLASQLTYLETRLERHLLGNHLQRNVQALALGSLALHGGRAAAWRTYLDSAWSQIDEQLTRDHVHVERSPMYHALALVDWLELVDVARAAGVAVPERVEQQLAGATRALGTLARPDGTLHRYNDCADGIAPPLSWIDTLAHRVVGTRIPTLRGVDARPDAGYFAWTDAGTGDRLFIDCGAIGPDYQPGHAHCDMLSFELDIAGRPVIVDAGTSGYAGDPLRAYQRSTRAHNTVMVDDAEQSEVWGMFRVGGRATPLGASLAADGERVTFDGAYRAFGNGRPTHQREMMRDAARAWRVSDRVSGASGRTLTSRLHLHPDFATTVEGMDVVAQAPDLTVRIAPFGIDHVRIGRGEHSPPLGWYAREFGRATPTSTIEMRCDRYAGAPFGFVLSLA